MRVLRLDQGEVEGPEETPETLVSQAGAAVENPIGELQELCQRQQISMPLYEFEEISEGFRCRVRAMGLRGTGEGRSKKEAKVVAAVGVLELVGG